MWDEQHTKKCLAQAQEPIATEDTLTIEDLAAMWQPVGMEL